MHTHRQISWRDGSCGLRHHRCRTIAENDSGRVAVASPPHCALAKGKGDAAVGRQQTTESGGAAYSRPASANEANLPAAKTK